MTEILFLDVEMAAAEKRWLQTSELLRDLGEPACCPLDLLTIEAYDVMAIRHDDALEASGSYSHGAACHFCS